jgi:hypothetical protein
MFVGKAMILLYNGAPERYLGVEEGLRGSLFRCDVTVRHHCFEVTDLTVDVETQA